MPAIPKNAIFNGVFLREGDFWVIDADGGVSAVVEVKTFETAVRERTFDFARTVAEYWSGRTRWFVLVTPSVGFAWRLDPHSPPVLAGEFATPPLLDAQFRQFEIDPARMTPLQFEIAVGAWLRDLPGGARPEGIDSALFGALTSGRSQHRAA